MKKFSKVLSLLLVFAMIVPGIAQAATVDAEEAAVVTRISGGNRYQTAANVSNQKFGKSKTVVLASGENWPDALAGTALAGVEGAPILLTAARRLHPDTKAELISLGAEKVIIVGGETVIPAAVADELKAMGLTVDRKEGLKREDTAVAAAKGMTSKTAIIANGYESFADALSAGAYAGMNGMPILFVRQNSVPAGTLEGLKALGIENVIIAGGTSAVSAKVQSELAAYNPTRIYGEVREETSLAFAEKFENNKEVIIANGYDYADALAGAALGAKIGAPVVLVNTNSMKTVVKEFIKENADKNHTVIGGTSAVSNNVVSDIEEIIAPVEEDELKVVSVSAINAQIIEVKFNRAVVDTSKAEFELLRGTFKQNATVEWAEDNKSATLKVAGKLQDSKYTVNVSGLTDEVLSETITVEAQKVASIEILDDIAVLSGKIATGTDLNTATATVGYQVKDQYGDDITKTTTLETNNEKITLDKSKGVITIGKDVIQGKKVGDLVPVVLIDKDTGVTTTKSVKLSDASAVDSLEIESIYNKDGKELNEDSDGSKFFLVLNLQDQYGKEIMDVELAKNLIATSTNKNVVDVAKSGEKLAVETKEIDGKDRLVVPFEKTVKAGTSKIILISSTNGATTEFEVNVAETTRTDAVDLGQPEIAVTSEKTLLPLTVQDKEGNTITDLKVLNDPVKGIKLSKGKVIVKDDKTFVELTAGTVGYETVVITTSTNKVSTVTFEVKKAATATVIRGLKKPLVVRTGDSVTLDKTYFNIEDQYGRVMTTSDKAILVEETEDKVVKVTANSTDITGLANGQSKLVVSLAGVEGSELEIPVRVTDGKEFASYELSSFDYKVKADVATDFTVNGILEDGGKTALKSGDYTAEIVNAKGEVVGSTTNGKINVPATALDEKDPKNPGTKIDTEFTLKVLVQATGKTLEEKFVVSNKDAVTQEAFFTTHAIGNADAYKKAKEITDVQVRNTFYTINTPVVSGNENTELNAAVVDQYGKKEVVGIAPSSVTIVPEDARQVSITNNGKANAKAALVADVNEAKLTVTVKIGNATEVLNVTLTRADSVITSSYDVSKTPVINTMFDGTITLTGTATGDVSVYAPNATVNNKATAPNGTITIEDVATGTWNEMADNNTIIVNDSTGITLNIAEGKIVKSLTLNQPTTVTNKGTVTALKVEKEGSTVTNNGTITELTNVASVKVDGQAPEKVTNKDNITGEVVANSEKKLNNQLASAKDFVYIPAWEYKDNVKFDTETNTFSGTYTKKEMTDVSSGDGTTAKATSDLARFLGALNRQDNSTIKSITFGESEYTWDSQGTFVGSNWKSGETTLVSSIATEFGTQLENGNLNPEVELTITDGITEVSLTISITVAE